MMLSAAPRRFPMRSLPGLALIATLALAFGGCSNRADDAPSPATGPGVASTPGGGPKNCLLILLDAFDAGHFSHLGYPRETTPNIDALAERGVSFSRAYSQCPNTVGSTVSFMTGRYLPQPHPDGVQYTLGSQWTTLAELFRGAGFSTAAYSENPYIHRSGGFDRGFSHFEMLPVLMPKNEAEKYRRRNEAVTPELLRKAGDWIHARGAGEPWFCYLHILRPHDPYFSPAPFAGKFRPAGETPDDPYRDLDIMWKSRWRKYEPTPEELQYVIDVYDGSIAYVDDLVGGFVDGLRAAGRLDETLVVIFSDHGEAFLQHGDFKHNTTVYDEMIHVPFVFIPPGGSDWKLGKRGEIVELVDLYPTLAELFGLKPASELHGSSLVHTLHGETPETGGTVYSQTIDGDRIAYRRDSSKLIFYNSPTGLKLIEWYDLEADPQEKQNLVYAKMPPPEVFQEARAAIGRHHQPPDAASAHYDAEQAEQLRALGYVDDSKDDDEEEEEE